MLITLTGILCVACFGISAITIHYNNEYSLVPDIYGMTYDDALSSLCNVGLDGRLALASTNEDLANGILASYGSQKKQAALSTKDQM